MKRLLLPVLVLPAFVFAQTNPAALAARQWRQQHEHAIVDELVTLMEVPNVTADKANILRNAELLVGMMEQRGIATQLLSAGGGNPVVFGELSVPAATSTIVFYAHYDGMPLDPAEWSSPPFTPMLRD